MAVRPDRQTSSSAPSRGRPSPTCSATWPPSAIGPTTPTPAWAPTSARAGWSTSHTEPARAGPARRAHPAAARRHRRPPARAAVDAPGEAIELARAGHSVVVASGTSSGKSLCYQVPIAEAASDPIRPGHRAGAVPHQGARPRPAPRAHRARAPGRGGRRLRRRRQPGGAHVGPEARVGGAHQPRDAPLRAAAAPRALGHVPRPAALHRARRAAHLPRRVRQPRRAARPPAAPAGRAPRRRSRVHLLVGHDRRAAAARHRHLRCRRRARCSTTARRAVRAPSRCGSRRCSTCTPAPAARRTARRPR